MSDRIYMEQQHAALQRQLAEAARLQFLQRENAALQREIAAVKAGATLPRGPGVPDGRTPLPPAAAVPPRPAPAPARPVALTPTEAALNARLQLAAAAKAAPATVEAARLEWERQRAAHGLQSPEARAAFAAYYQAEARAADVLLSARKAGLIR